MRILDACELLERYADGDIVASREAVADAISTVVAAARKFIGREPEPDGHPWVGELIVPIDQTSWLAAAIAPIRVTSVTDDGERWLGKSDATGGTASGAVENWRVAEPDDLPAEPDWREEEAIRASGDAICPICDRPYWRHHQVAKDEVPTLVRACDGRLLKL